ncbi:MAG: hypothetical protein IJ594_02455 [Oscillospiraceae bacterium]|nr:hypothetical protein [Oscillospiraceae bacterium]
MAERYTKLFVLDGMPYTEGSPVLIMAGAMLLDSYSGDLLCQLRVRSLSEASVKAVTVQIQMLDIAGAPLSTPVRHQYLDLELPRGGECGRDTAIILPRRDARSFTAVPAEVIFADNSRWQPGEGCVWQSLAPPQTLEEAYGDAQMAEQFRIRYGADCRNMPRADEALWFCACGAVNDAQENSCFNCRRVRSALLNVSPDSLKQEVAGRLKQEQLQEEQDKLDSKARLRRYLKTACIVVPLLLLAIGLLMTVPGLVQQKQAYDNAAALLAAGRYEYAAEAFEALGSYKDSAEQAEKNVPYQRALYILDRAAANDAAALSLVGHTRSELSDQVTAAMLLYEGAMEEFKALGDYKDSADLVERCKEGVKEAEQAVLQRSYDAALALLQEQRYSEAREAFLALGDFSDSADMAKEAVYQKALALYHYIETYDVRQIYADLSMSPERGSTFSLIKAAALAQGSQCVADLRTACGADLTDVNLADAPGQSQKLLAESVIALFEQLDGYRDSEDCIAGILDLTDYTKDFYMLCETGDLYGAYDWLTAYDGEFADRDRWLSLLDLYKPYCTSWTLYGGDVTAIPLTVGRSQPCMSFSTRVLLSADKAVLRLSANDGEEYFLDLRAEPGETRFSNYDNDPYMYLAVVTNGGHLSYMKYNGDGKLITSCEYSEG